MSANAEYDIIFAGGGAAGCLTAGRLATADPSLRILILEHGPHSRDVQSHTMPAAYLSHLAPGSKTASFHVAQPSKAMNGREVIVPSGKCVGGGSAINFLMYTRAAASDYDDWENVHGNEGWGSKDLIPLLQKTETYEAAPGKETHGYTGPLHVSSGGHFSAIGDDFMKLAAQYDGIERSAAGDPNDTKSPNVYGPWLKWINKETGKRQDTAHHFVYNQSSNSNLVVQPESKVKWVVFDKDRATGVEYTRADGTSVIANAKRLVVVSAGAFGTPTILQRSGVGSKELLGKLGVPLVSDLPGVGENYQDHNLLLPCYLSDNETPTFDQIFRGDPTEIAKHTDDFAKGTGLLASNGIDAGVKLRPVTKTDFNELGPSFTDRWASYYENHADKPLMWMGVASSFLGDFSAAPLDKFRYFMMGYFSGYPVSTGSVKISDSCNVDAPPVFHAGFLEDPTDLDILRWGYKRSRELARRMPSYRGEHAASHPKFPEGSPAAAGEKSGPVPVDAPGLEYTKEDDEAIEKYHRDNVQTTWHSMSTCSMKPRERGGVVDSKLHVYGTKNLICADLSICPSNVGSNTYSTALVVGEKAAVLIAEELGIQGV